jgi:hypothetical protein
MRSKWGSVDDTGANDTPKSWSPSRMPSCTPLIAIVLGTEKSPAVKVSVLVDVGGGVATAVPSPEDPGSTGNAAAVSPDADDDDDDEEPDDDEPDDDEPDDDDELASSSPPLPPVAFVPPLDAGAAEDPAPADTRRASVVSLLR